MEKQKDSHGPGASTDKSQVSQYFPAFSDQAHLSVKHGSVWYSPHFREEVPAAFTGHTHHMHCTVWVPGLAGQKILAGEKPSLVFLLGYNIQARVNFLVSPHIWRRKEKKELNLFCYLERERKSNLKTDWNTSNTKLKIPCWHHGFEIFTRRPVFQF